jgi:amino acid adenylation domain-containing protein
MREQSQAIGHRPDGQDAAASQGSGARPLTSETARPRPRRRSGAKSSLAACRSMVDVARLRARRCAAKHAYTFLTDGEREAATLTFAELDCNARRVAAALDQRRLRGERALLLYPPGLEFITALLGCFYAGVVAVPAYPPRATRADPRLRGILADCAPRAALTTSALHSRLPAFAEHLPGLGGLFWLPTDGRGLPPASAWREHTLAAESLALLQYTSGSTDAPRGVMVSHANLLHNERMIAQAFAQDEDSVVVGWLPLHHDMGLIGNVLQPLYVAARCVLMAPTAFLQRPARWLEAISRYRATTSGGPNFAYDLCVRKVLPDPAALDLGCWRVAFNGAEPVRAETLRRFAHTFASCGFRAAASYPCYGLAEATLFVSGGLPGKEAAIATLDASCLARHQAVEPTGADAAPRTVPSCGWPRLGQRIAIVDPQSKLPCPPGRIGEVWISGASVAQGYWRRPEESAQAFGATLPAGAGRYLRTGDLGFLRGSELFLTGRIKDLIIVRGRNHYPQDIELTVERSHPGLRPGGAAAFAVEAEGQERVVVLCELERRGTAGEATPLPAPEVAAAIRAAVAAEHDLEIFDIGLMRGGTLPKTSSGKIQRHACRAAYLAGSLALLSRHPLAEPQPDESAAREAAAPLGREHLLALGLAQRTARLESYLACALTRQARIPPSPIDPQSKLSEFALDSLAAIELGNRLAADLALDFSPAELLAGEGSLCDLAARLAAAVETAPGDPWPPVPGGDGEAGELPLSRGQEALWFIDRLAPGGAVYNLVAAARVRSPLDEPALERCLQALITRHPALHSTFDDSRGQPVRRVHPDLPGEFLTAEAGETAWAEQVERQAYRPFALATGPPLRAGVVRLPAGDAIVWLAVHHIVADFWSLAVLLRELGELYCQETRATPAALPPLSATYTDYVRWQARELAGERGERLWSYWRRELAGDLPVLDLPTDQPRPPLQTYRGAARTLQLAGPLTERIRAAARAAGATLHMALLALFQALLQRYTGQLDLVVGSPAAARPAPQLSSVVGYFANLLPLRGDLSGNPGFARLLERTRAAVLGALAHQHYPFALLVNRLGAAHDPGRPPLCQVAFVLERAQFPELRWLAPFALGVPGVAGELAGLALESVELRRRPSRFELTLMMAELSGGLAACLEFNVDLFDASTAARLLRHLEGLVETVTAEPARPLAELPWLSAAERFQLLVEWNDTAGIEAQDSIHALFARRARERPHAVAVLSPAGSLTYAEVERGACRMARRLQASGVRTGSLVGVYLERSSDMVPALLGILAAGAAYVPLETAYPPARQRWILSSLGIRWLVVTAGRRAAARELQAELPGLDHLVAVERTVAARAEPSPPPRQERPAPWTPAPQPAGREDLAYILFTSGSTGLPKGVMMGHGPVVNLIDWVNTTLAVTPADRGLFITALAFDLSVYDLFGVLAAGGSVRVASDEEVGEPALLARAMAEEAITFWDSAPAALQQLVPMLAPYAGPPLSALRLAFLSGDWIPTTLPAELVRCAPGCRVIALGGATEAAIWSNFFPITEVDPRWTSIPYGRPIRNARYLVLDSAFAPCPIGVPGDLYIGGSCLASGYAGSPQLTAAKFLPDPFARLPGARLYRTGDRARLGAGGLIEFLGRLDQQVKIRGFRIELGEIESVLGEHPEVRDAVVLAREDEPGQKRLVAYVVARQPPGPPLDELRRTLANRLPDYMVPAAFVTLAALPLTANGKLDRRALPPPPAPARSRSGPRLPPGAVEEALAALWEDLLGRQRVGPGDNFFALGGDSLQATRLVSRVRDLFGLELPLRRLFELPTLASLAAELTAALRGGGAPQAPPLLAAPDDGRSPLSPAQERLWVLDQLQPGSAAYNLPAAFHCTGPLDGEVLAAALGEVVLRHETLRTTFVATDLGTLQAIAPPTPMPLARLDLRDLPAARRDGLVRELLATEAARPFDLRRGPLLRALLLHLAKHEQVVLVNLHHIIADAWSVVVLSRELTALYAAFAAGRPSPLPKLAVQYRDFARWQRAWLEGGALATQLAYWRRQLAGAPPLLALPADRPRPAVASGRGAAEPLALGSALTVGARSLARTQGATPFMLLLAAFKALLLRYTGETDLVVGSPIANRGRSELEGLIGFFANTLVLRTDLAGDPSFGQLLARVREVALGAYLHQDLPFERLVESLQPERDLGRSPLVQILFELHRLPLQAFELPGLALRPLPIPEQTAKFDTVLSLEESDAEVAGQWSFNTDLFERATVARLARHYRALLAGALSDPRRPLSGLPLLAPAERHQLLIEWDGPDSPRPADGCLHRLVEDQARRSAEAVAVVAPGENESLTFAGLNARANQLARHLRRLGVGPETVVALCLERSCAMVVGLLAILKSGGAYLPLDPDYPRERLRFMLDDSGAAVLLTCRALAARLGEPAAGWTVLLDDPGAPSSPWSRRSGADLDVAVHPDNLAYVIFTSGSTGRPKGTLNTHRSIVNRLLSMQEQFRLAADDAVLQKTPLSFDVSVWELFWPLLAGARLVMARPGEQRDRTSLLQTIAEQGITTVHFVPAMLRAFLDGVAPAGTPAGSPGAAAGRRAPGHQLTSLRRVLASGEALSHELQRQYHAALATPLHNLYGPTEAAIDVTSWACDPTGTRRLVPIGRPAPNTRIRLLDRDGCVVPIGAPAELHIGGVQVSRGYLGRPGLTAESFVPDLLAARGRPGEVPGRGNLPGGARLYRTGDLARYLPDGAVEYLGRCDGQVKIRGFRIELGEIEALLAAHPAVRAAAVALRSPAAKARHGASPAGRPAGAVGGVEQRLVAYVVPQRGHAATPPPPGAMAAAAAPVSLAELRGALARDLPEHMLPSELVLLDGLPLTPSGKLDRKALPEPVWGQGTRGAGPGAPRTAAEELLAGLWAEVLGIEHIGAGDDFFALGGHSLLATQLVSRLRQVFGVELPLRLLFESHTLAELASRIEAALHRPRHPEPPLLPSQATSAPLSFAQERLWFLDRLEPGGTHYLIPALVALRGTLDLAALAGSFAELVRRQGALRTSFVDRGGTPRQVVEPALAPDLPLADLLALPSALRRGERRRLIREQLRRPLALQRGPLLRLLLLRLGEDEWQLLLVVHHIVCDGWSLGVLVREIMALYAAFAHRRPSPLPELPVQFVDFTLWQRRWLQGAALDEQLAYWRHALAGLPPRLDLSIDRPRPPLQSYRGASASLILGDGLPEALAALGLRQRVTLFMSLLAGFEALLHAYTRQPLVAVGTAVANRRRREVEDLVGLFANTLVLPGDLGGEPTGRELLARVREVALASYAHQDAPFEKLVEALQPRRDLSHSPLFQAMLVLEDATPRTVQLPGLVPEILDLATGTAKFDLLVLVAPAGSDLAVTCEYASDLYDAPTIVRLLAHFRNLLAALAADPGRRLGALPLLGSSERHQLLVEWNDTLPPWRHDRCLHQLFEEQVERTPESLAVLAGFAGLTYRELDARASRLAGSLRRMGAGPEVRVGVCLARSPQLLVALLAILKAGAAYVPLDPAYPRRRLAFIVADAGMPLIVTDAASLPVLPAGRARRVCLEGDWPDLASPGRLDPGPPSCPANLAYLIYTSGSTGRPKGVALTHLGAVARMRWALRAFAARDLAGVLAATSICFDLSVFEIFAPLSAGGTVVLAADALHLPEVASTHRVSLINTVPSVLAELLRSAPPPPAGLRVVNLAGEALPPTLLDQVRRWSGAVRVLNLYGPSEDTTYSTCACVAGGAPSPPIGRPLAGTRVYLLDAALQPVPIGLAGALHLAGDGLARGYHQRPGLTAERFIPNPFADRSGDRLYRTGDLGRWRGDGDLEFLGRVDGQVKVRGFRIELGEVEAGLLAHPGVREAAAVVREHVPGERFLAAFAAPAGEPAPTGRELRRHLARHLPAYMVPADVVLVPALPRLPNGKVDRASLPAARPEQPVAPEPVRPPATATERLLAEMWSELLRRPTPGADDNFFDLGGHSLLALQLATRVRERCGVELALRSIFQHTTLRGLAAEIAAQAGERGAPRSPEVMPVARDGGPLPLAPAQQGFWLLAVHHPGSPICHLAGAVRLSGLLDPGALAGALSQVARRHEALRMGFATVDGQPVQIIHPPRPLAPLVVDLRALSASSRRVEALRLAQSAARRPFALGSGSLLRLVLLRLCRQRHVVVVVLHHLIADGWSVTLLLRELAALYSAGVRGAASPLPDPPVQYGDFVGWQRRRLQGELLASQLAYWQRHLEGAPPRLDLPTDQPRPQVRSLRGASRGLLLPPQFAAELDGLARREGVTLFLVLLAAFQILLHQYSGEDDLVIGCNLANRQHRSLEGLMGMLANTVALRTSLAGDPTLRELLARVREVSLAAHAHPDLPLEWLLAALRPPREPGFRPLFQVMMAVLTAPWALAEFSGLRLEPFAVDLGVARADLTLFFLQQPTGISAVLEYSTDLFEAATADSVLEQLRLLLAALPAGADRRISQLTPRTAATERLVHAFAQPLDG